MQLIDRSISLRPVPEDPTPTLRHGISRSARITHSNALRAPYAPKLYDKREQTNDTDYTN